MSVTLPTSALLGMLADLLHTCDDNPEVATGCILVHTALADDPIDVGRTTVLSGTSTSSTTGLIGHCREVADGTLAPVLLPNDGVSMTIAAFKPLLVEERRNEITTFLRITADAGRILISRVDDPGLFEVDEQQKQVRFPAGNLAKFPRSVWSALAEEHVAGEEDVVGPRRVLPLEAAKAFVSVARRRKGKFETFSPHPSAPTRVQVGLTYQGLIPAPSEEDGVTSTIPTFDVIHPPLPDQELTPVLRPTG
ncbi:hypothetical protein [Actinoalloteichus sp. GBA129-24]|uniref:hypothetical protein n=1 Tax=Actinoalloteichus sp. GBA129-24 TaxID=1612551 RepID=UPI000950619E|nr:hypothetical protein [Actinoalloteichus sp. GBA129-24]APU20897.1 hypothetical protein UA75_14435 [Actinoalloteichus sp. GBA129-24]APU24146.1 hypothetical protein UA75_30915 [Actinoalloteichus sp. GBA129-24]